MKDQKCHCCKKGLYSYTMIKLCGIANCYENTCSACKYCGMHFSLKDIIQYIEINEHMVYNTTNRFILKDYERELFSLNCVKKLMEKEIKDSYNILQELDLDKSIITYHKFEKNICNIITSYLY